MVGWKTMVEVCCISKKLCISAKGIFFWLKVCCHVCSHLRKVQVIRLYSFIHQHLTAPEQHSTASSERLQWVLKKNNNVTLLTEDSACLDCCTCQRSSLLTHRSLHKQSDQLLCANSFFTFAQNTGSDNDNSHGSSKFAALERNG